MNSKRTTSANFPPKWWENLPLEEFQSNFRMTMETFTDLQAEIDDRDNRYSPEIDVALLACLWILGTNASLEEAEQRFSLGENFKSILDDKLRKIIALKDSYLTWPNENEAKIIEKDFEAKYGFPGVTGVIGSLYIEVKADNTANMDKYFNRETKKYMFVLQIVCDSNLLIRDSCIGFPGGYSVGDILRNSPLYAKLKNPDEYLIKKKKHLLGGYSHPELETLITPFESAELSAEKYRFNIVHENVMSVVEKTLQCIECRFPRLTGVENFSPDFASILIGAICVLHNFTRVKNDDCFVIE